jgi:hypothetical protein
MGVLHLDFLPVVAVLHFNLVRDDDLGLGVFLAGDSDLLADRIRQRDGIGRQRPGLAIGQDGDRDAALGARSAAGAAMLLTCGSAGGVAVRVHQFPGDGLGILVGGAGGQREAGDHERRAAQGDECLAHI